MAYNDVIERGTMPTYVAGSNGVAALIEDDVAKSIIDGTIEKSAALRMMRHIPMSTKVYRMPALSALPSAYWVNGDTGLKQTTEMAWKNKFLTAEELAVIVPIPRVVLADTSHDLWGYTKPRIEEALAVALDKAVLFGVDKPAAFPAAIGPACVTVGNFVEETTGLDVLADISEVFGKVEGDGHEVTAVWYANTLRKTIRNLRDANRGLIFQSSAVSGGGFDKASSKVEYIWGFPATTSKLNTFETQVAGGTAAANEIRLLAGDWSQALLGVRQDLEYTMLDQAVIQDAGGNIIYNLPQQGMVALMVTCRYGYQVSNPINRLNTVEGDTLASGDRWPFAALTAFVA